MEKISAIKKVTKPDTTEVTVLTMTLTVLPTPAVSTFIISVIRLFQSICARESAIVSGRIPCFSHQAVKSEITPGTPDTITRIQETSSGITSTIKRTTIITRVAKASTMHRGLLAFTLTPELALPKIWRS